MLLDAFIIGPKFEIKGREGLWILDMTARIHHLTLSSVVRVKWNFDCWWCNRTLPGHWFRSVHELSLWKTCYLILLKLLIKLFLWYQTAAIWFNPLYVKVRLYPGQKGLRFWGHNTDCIRLTDKEPLTWGPLNFVD